MQLKSASGYEAWFAPLLIAIVSGIIVSKPILAPASRSPSASAALVTEKFGDQELVLARAWEDPLLAVSGEAPKPAGKPSEAEPATASPGGLATQGALTDDIVLQVPQKVLNSDAIPADKDLLIILQTMPGGPGLEDEENRRQFRLASTLGLQRCKFEPTSGGLVRIHVQSPVRAGLGNVLAAQWFAGPDGKRALLVFVPDVILDDHKGLHRLKQIAATLQKESGYAPNRTSLVILRTSSSELIDDLAWAASNDALALKKCSVINTGSTVPLVTIFSGVDARLGTENTKVTLRESLGNVRARMEAREAPSGSGGEMLTQLNGWHFGRVMASDQVLTDMLLAELELRRRSPMSERNAVAVLCESDSTYGRKFAEFVESKQLGDRVAVFHFQGGIDIAPRSSQGRNAYQKHRDEAEDQSRTGVTTSHTTPLGPRSIDYVFRQLAAWEQELAQQGDDLSAVLLFAYDHYDKRPLIQLVRSRFPDALILTTDLHALMSDPGDFETMRNVVVASHLGLTAGSELQNGLPPFRSSYQTSLFLGTIFAVESSDRGASKLAPAINAMDAWAPRGRVYEIGRNGAVVMTQTDAPSDGVYYAQPKPERYRISSASLGLMFAMLLLAMAWCTRRTRSDPASWTIFAPTIMMMAMMCVVYPLRVGLWSVSSEILAVITFAILLLAGVYFQQWRLPSFRRTILALSPVAIVVFVYLAISADMATNVAGGIIGGIGLIVFLSVVLSLDGARTETGLVSPDVEISRRISACLWVCIVCGSLAFSFLLIRGVGPALGEPWGWLDGVSAWPSEMVRIVAIVMAGACIVACARCVTRQLYDSVACLAPMPMRPVVQGAITTDKHATRSFSRILVRSTVQGSTLGWLERGRAFAVGGFKNAREAVERSAITTWTCPLNEFGRVRVDVLLETLRQRSRPPALVIRLTLLSMIVATIVVGSLIALDVPHAPVRGHAAFMVHIVIMIILGIVLNFLVLQVLDAGNLCNRFVSLLGAAHSRWPNERRHAAAAESGLPEEQIDSLLDVTAVANATAKVNTLIYYPMLVIIISAIAWHARIDAWPLSSVLIILYGLSAVACVAVGWSMRRSAERLRTSEVQRLRTELNRIESLDEMVARDVLDGKKLGVLLELKLGRKGYIDAITTLESYSDRTNVLAIGNLTAIAISESVVHPVTSETGDAMSWCTVVCRRASSSAVVMEREGRELTTLECKMLLESLKVAATTEERRRRMEQTKTRQKARIESMITQIQAISQGSFGPWSADPVMRAVIFPMVGILSVRFAEWIGVIFRGA